MKKPFLFFFPAFIGALSSQAYAQDGTNLPACPKYMSYYTRKGGDKCPEADPRRCVTIKNPAASRKMAGEIMRYVHSTDAAVALRFTTKYPRVAKKLADYGFDFYAAKQGAPQGAGGSHLHADDLIHDLIGYYYFGGTVDLLIKQGKLGTKAGRAMLPTKAHIQIISPKWGKRLLRVGFLAKNLTISGIAMSFIETGRVPDQALSRRLQEDPIAISYMTEEDYNVLCHALDFGPNSFRWIMDPIRKRYSEALWGEVFKVASAIQDEECRQQFDQNRRDMKDPYCGDLFQRYKIQEDQKSRDNDRALRR